MARTLPWKAAQSSNSNTATPRSTDRLKRIASPSLPLVTLEASRENATSPSSTNHVRTQPQRRQRRAISRTPSTSPPPGPPVVEHMQSGFDADDRYMIVEDELLQVAQFFTAHLHHAEYKRLVKKAKERSSQTNLHSQSLTRNLSGESRQRLRRTVLTSRQNSALQGMTRPVSTRDKTASSAADPDDLVKLDDDDDYVPDDIVEVAEASVPELWAGTSLAGLMTSDSQQKKTSLIGLQKLSTSTKAARGFKPDEKRDAPIAGVGLKAKRDPRKAYTTERKTNLMEPEDLNQAKVLNFASTASISRTTSSSVSSRKAAGTKSSSPSSNITANRARPPKSSPQKSRNQDRDWLKRFDTDLGSFDYE